MNNQIYLFILLLIKNCYSQIFAFTNNSAMTHGDIEFYSMLQKCQIVSNNKLFHYENMISRDSRSS